MCKPDLLISFQTFYRRFFKSLEFILSYVGFPEKVVLISVVNLKPNQLKNDLTEQSYNGKRFKQLNVKFHKQDFLTKNRKLTAILNRLYKAIALTII